MTNWFFILAFSCSCPSYKTELVLVQHLLPHHPYHHPDLQKHSKIYKNCTGSVTLNNFYCDFLRVGSRVARFKAFFFLTELQMANVWTNKPCQSSLKGLKMFTDTQPWGRGESKLNFLGKQCKLKQIQQQLNAYTTSIVKQRQNINNTLFDTLTSLKITPFVYLIVILCYSHAKKYI